MLFDVFRCNLLRFVIEINDFELIEEFLFLVKIEN